MNQTPVLILNVVIYGLILVIVLDWKGVLLRMNLLKRRGRKSWRIARLEGDEFDGITASFHLPLFGIRTDKYTPK